MNHQKKKIKKKEQNKFDKLIWILLKKQVVMNIVLGGRADSGAQLPGAAQALGAHGTGTHFCALRLRDQGCCISVCFEEHTFRRDNAGCQITGHLVTPSTNAEFTLLKVSWQR